MSRPRVIARASAAFDFSRLRSELLDERATIDDKLRALDVLEGLGRQETGVTIASRLVRGGATPTPGKTPAKPNAGKAASARTALWAKARAMYERGDDVKVIARLIEKTSSAVMYHVSTEGWKRKRGGVELAGQVRCPKCSSMTKHDPCEHCGAKVRQP